ncbi:MAG: hypothetical protein Q7U57_00050 [Methylovulum sp.]|nr:hypothetical protein [Methylovulum sp.]
MNDDPTFDSNLIDGCRQAFPSNLIDGSLHIAGMTLRDYFAAKAMQGFAAAPDMKDIDSFRIAVTAYEFADDMMIVRSWHKEETK